jgi:hypothetical protein
MGGPFRHPYSSTERGTEGEKEQPLRLTSHKSVPEFQVSFVRRCLDIWQRLHTQREHSSPKMCLLDDSTCSKDGTHVQVTVAIAELVFQTTIAL